MAKTLSKRYSGVLAHPTSFPSPYGIGDFGKGAYDFINFLTGAGQSLWQILPLGHTGYGDSPYQAFSAFAGQPLLISGVFGLLVGAFCFVLARPMIRLFYGAIEADVLDASVLYLRIIAISYPFLALYNGGAALFRSMGNSKISMQISFLMNVINIVGNAVCIFG